MSSQLFFLGDWQVTPESNSLRCGHTHKQLEPKAMDVLLVLCQQQGEVLSADEIVDRCWGSADMGDNPVHKAINQLRSALGDKATSPTYIETIRKRGYRIIGKLSFPLNDEARAAQGEWRSGSPFPGLSAFKADESNVFFGRTQQVNSLLESTAKQVNVGRAFCLILGPSGTGKSSLVNAGLLPKLLNEKGYDGIGVVSHSSLDFADVSQANLFTDIASAMLDWELDEQLVFDGFSAQTLAVELQTNCSSVIALCIQAINTVKEQHYAKPHWFLFIDRLEVLLSSPLFSDDERQQFLGVIEQLTCSGCVLIFSACRNDFYPLVVNHASLMAGKANGSHFDLTAPSRGELMQMIRLPAVAANLTWSFDEARAQSLDEILCDEAANHPDSLPMLQYTLQELYLQRDDNDQLLVSVYQSLGGIEGAIGQQAEDLYQSLPEAHQEQLAFVLSLLVTLSADGETITSRAARWSQLVDSSQKAFVQALVDSRLFVSHLQNNQPCFSLAHEALLRRWQRATDWINTHRNTLEVKSRIHNLTAQWVAEHKSPAYLLAEGKPLIEAQALQNNVFFSLDDQEQALIKASGQKARVKRWLKSSTIVMLCLLTFIAVTMSYQSQQAQSVAQQKRQEAESLLGFMVGEFADKLRSVKRMDLLDGISNKALEYFSQQETESDISSLLSFTNSEQDFKTRFQHAQTLGAIGEVAYSRAKEDEAFKGFSAAKVILNELYHQQPENMELLKTLGANAFWLGQLAYDQSDYDSARPLFELYRDYSLKMNKLEPDNIEGWIELSYSHNTLGSLLQAQQNYQFAKAEFEESLALKKRAAAQRSEDKELSIGMADTLSWLAETELNLGHLSRAFELLHENQEILIHGLSGEPEDANLMESLAHSYETLARVLSYTADLNQAYSYASKAVFVLQKMLLQDQSSRYWKNLYLQTNYLRLSIQEQLDQGLGPNELRELPDLMDGSEQVLLDAAKYYHITKAWPQSKPIIAALKKRLITSLVYPSTKYTYMLAETYLLEAQQAEQDEEYRAEQCQKVIQLLKPLVSVSNHVLFLASYVKSHDCIDQLTNVSEKVDALKKMGVINFHF